MHASCLFICFASSFLVTSANDVWELVIINVHC